MLEKFNISPFCLIVFLQVPPSQELQEQMEEMETYYKNKIKSLEERVSIFTELTDSIVFNISFLITALLKVLILVEHGNHSEM